MIAISPKLGTKADRRGRGRRGLWRAITVFASLVSVVLVGGLPPEVQAAQEVKPIDIKQRYREVLGVLAAGDLEAALTALMELEPRVVGDSQPWRRIDSLWRLKLRVLRDLLSSQPPELLRPVLVLHHDAYFGYAEAGRRHLAHHSRQMTMELAEIYVERAGSSESRVFSGWVLASFGAHLWSPTSIGESADLFDRAHRVDPGNRMALQGLVAAYEKNGEYDQALEYLGRELLLDPFNAEARLRLALCQLRSPEDLTDRAVGQLTTLMGDGSPVWIRSVAYQELVRFHLENQEEEAAEKLLRSGLAALPGDQQLSIQLAALLDRQRRRTQALRTLDQSAADGWAQESSRYRYDVWRPEGIDAKRVELHEAMKTGLASLEAALLVAPVQEEAE